MQTRLLFVHVLSPLHAGTGQGVGVIDLPIAREKATQLPYVPGSSVKGTLRDRCTDERERKIVFGPDTNAAEEHAGAAIFADQRLLCLPIRSLAGTFAWVTCPYILHRLRRDASEVEASLSGVDMPTTAQVPAPADITQCLVIPDSQVLAVEENRAYLEDCDLNLHGTADVLSWATWLGAQFFPDDTAWQAMFAERLCVVHDDLFSFLLQTATEVVARVKLLDDKKTVQQGGLWYEEALPTETLLYGMVLEMPIRQNGKNGAPVKVFDVIENLTGAALQFGGKATVGRGLCRVHLA
jgi:CRISPR-associated protein Cmr4